MITIFKVGKYHELEFFTCKQQGDNEIHGRLIKRTIGKSPETWGESKLVNCLTNEETLESGWYRTSDHEAALRLVKSNWPEYFKNAVRSA